MISDHTRRYLKEEVYFPGPVIDRANRSRWQEEGGLTLGESAHREVERLIEEHQPVRLSAEVKRQLTELMKAEAQRYGIQSLPEIS